MLLKNVLLLLSMILLSSIVSSCAQIPNVPICKEITPDRGYCSWTLSPGGFMVDDQNPYAFNPKKPDEKFTWWEIRPVMMQMPPYSWAELKKYLIKQCRNKKCRNGVGQWMDRMEKGDFNAKSNEDWNEPEFQEEVRELLHGLTTPGEQSSGEPPCSGDRGSQN